MALKQITVTLFKDGGAKMELQLLLLILGPILVVAILLKITHVLQWKKMEVVFKKLDDRILDHKNRRKLVFEVYLVLLAL